VGVANPNLGKEGAVGGRR